MFGLSLDIVPDVYTQVPSLMRPLFDSSLTLATVVAVLLRWGAARPATAQPKAAHADQQPAIEH